MSNYNSEDYVSRYLELMNSWRSCWSSCNSGCNGYGLFDDDDDLFAQLCDPNCAGCSGDPGDCSEECQEECDDCKCSRVKKPNSETIRDDGCFCRKCNDFVPMAEPDGKDGKILCYGCENEF